MNPTELNRYIGGQLFVIKDQRKSVGEKIAVWHRGEIKKIETDSSGKLTVHLAWLAIRHAGMDWVDGSDGVLVFTFEKASYLVVNNEIVSVATHHDDDLLKAWLYLPGHLTNIIWP